MKLISVNIERRRHLERLRSFFIAEQPDVVCIQELCEQDVPFFEELLGLSAVFVPTHYTDIANDNEGIGIFATKITKPADYWLGGHREGPMVTADETSRHSFFLTAQFKLLVAKVLVDGVEFVIGNTHLPATDRGEVIDCQMKTLANLLEKTNKYDDLVLCGDFNAPRGKEAFSQLIERYKDNIPEEYESSLDANLHRAGYLPFMVDGLFSTPNYQIENVQLKGGVSDHMAVVGEVKKV